MDRRDDDTGEVAWPGFVDILSAVIIMFVFFVMITAIVMYALSVEHKESLSQQSEQKLQKMLTEEVAELVKKIEDGEVTIEEIKTSQEQGQRVQELEKDNKDLSKDKMELEYELEKLTSSIQQIQSDFAGGDGENTVIEKDGFFFIIFERKDITVSEDTVAFIEKKLAAKKKAFGGKKFKIRLVATDNPDAPTITVSRELALARALNVRNVFIEKDIDPSLVSFKYSKPEEVEKSYNWVKVGIFVQ